MNNATLHSGAEALEHFAEDVDAVTSAEAREHARTLRAYAAQLADLRRALRAYDLAGPETDTRRQALADVLKLARQLTEE